MATDATLPLVPDAKQHRGARQRGPSWWAGKENDGEEGDTTQLSEWGELGDMTGVSSVGKWSPTPEDDEKARAKMQGRYGG